MRKPMAKYRHKPLEVEAVQISYDNYHALGLKSFKGKLYLKNKGVDFGDYIVWTGKRIKQVCKKRVFEATYEPITDIYTTLNGSR